FMSKHFYSTKTLRQVISVSIILILIDIFTGYSKWALTYVIPFVLAGTTLLLPIIVASMPAKYFLHVRSLLLLIIFRSEEHTSELQSRENLVCRLLLEK